MLVPPLAVEIVRGAGQALWSPRMADTPARMTIRALGAGFGAANPTAATPLEKAWIELCRMAAASGNDARWRAIRNTGAQPYAVIGDSHSRLLVRRARDPNGRWLAPLWWLETGASARGLGRADARSGAGGRVRAAIDQALGRIEAPVLLKFGQVDIEFVQVFQRLERRERTFDPAAFQVFVLETMARYVAFVTGAVAPADRARVRLCGLFPPALSDAAWRIGYLNAHITAMHGPAARDDLAERLAGIEIPDLARRTALHRDANIALAMAAEAEGLGFLDDFTPFLSGAGEVDPRYLGPAQGADHHLDFHAVRPQVVDRLWPLFA